MQRQHVVSYPYIPDVYFIVFLCAAEKDAISHAALKFGH
jgi:hypothetical protein